MPPRSQSRDPRSDPRAALGEQLRIARQAAGFRSQSELGRLIGADTSVIAKAETGDRPPTNPVYELWMEKCGIVGRERELYDVLLGLARVKEGGPAKIWFAGWVDAEGRAHTLRIWQPLIFPGLIQTEAYATALYATTGMSDEEIREHVQARLNRQTIFDQPEPPSVVIVLDELVLHRLIGSPELMRDQLTRAIELSRRPNVHIHILPSRTGANLGLGGPIHLATTMGTPEVLLVGTLIEDQVTAEPTLVRKASATFDAVRGDALNRADSRRMMTEALENIWND
ncbi:MAG TPA: helix-turn-helix transcriptional regulator [Trebonia sp.]|nr:helix-turn-helix transcriptional regulator [Trebonia sp.]